MTEKRKLTETEKVMNPNVKNLLDFGKNCEDTVSALLNSLILSFTF